MSFGSFLQGIGAQLNPFDNGKTYGTYNPPQKKKIQQPSTPSLDVQPRSFVNTIKTNQSPVSFGTLKVNNQVAPPSKTYTDQTKPRPYKAADVGVSAAANVASGFAESAAKLAGAPLSVASFIARKTGHKQVANNIDTVNVPSKIGNNIAAARKEVDVASQKEGINTPYQVASRVAGTALAVPAIGEGLVNVAKVPRLVKGAPKTANVIDKTGAALGGRILPRIRNIFKGNPAEATPTDAAAAGEAANTAPEVTQIPVSQPNEIPVAQTGGATPVNVRQVPKRVIQEVGGDATHTTTAAKSAADVAAAKDRQATEAFAKQLENAGTPDKRIEGVSTPQPSSYVTEADIQAERDALDKALANKEITKTQYRESNKALDTTPTIDGKPADAKQIRVKEVQSLDVGGTNDVPVNTAQTPGKVRVTTETAPTQAKTEAAAAQPAANPEALMGRGKAPSGALVSGRKEAAAAETPKPEINPTSPNDPFYQGLGADLVGNIKQATQANKELKALRTAQKGQRLGAATAASSKAEGEAKLKAFFGNMSGDYAKSSGYVGSNHSQDVIDRVINDVMNETGQQGFNRANTAKAFQKVFRAGQEVGGETLGAPTKSDIRLVKEFLNRKIGGTTGDDIVNAYHEMLANKPTKEDFGLMSNFLGTPRVLMTAGDISVSGRQAFKLGLQHPLEFVKANGRALKYAFNPKAYEKAISDLQNSDVANFMQDNMKVKLPMLAHTDDYYWGDQWANKIPLVNKFVQASERQYNAVLNDMRYAASAKQINKAGGLDEFQRILFEKSGGDYEKFNKALAQWGNVVNNLSGSGDIGNFIAKNPGISSLLFAPRNLAAKFNTFNPIWYANIAKTNPAAAIYAAKSMGTYLATVGGVLLAVKKAGGSVEVDPRSSDFGAIKIGNTRYDFTGGDRTVATFISRMFLGLGSVVDHNLPADYVSTKDGSTSRETPISLVGRFLENKAAPVTGLVVNLLNLKPNKDGTGVVDAYGTAFNSKSVWGALANLTTPLAAQDVASAYNDTGSIPQAAAAGAASFVGAGVNTYGDAKTKDQPALNAQVANQFSDVQTDNVRNLLTKDDQKLYDQVFKSNAYELSATDTNKLNTAIKDTAPKLLENGDYQTHAAVIQHEINVLEQNPSTTNAKIAGLQKEVKQDGVLQQNNIPYSLFNLYQTTSNSAWRAMGDPTNENYDPTTYAQLEAIDKLFTGAGVSENSKYSDRNKYSASGSGSGKKIETSFGTLSTSGNPFAPKVKQYQTGDLTTNSIPLISRVQPHIVHKIGT